MIHNEYPEEVVDKVIKDRMDKEKEKGLSEQANVIDDTNKKRFIVLPYVSRKCESFGNKLKHLVEKTFSDVDMNVAFETPKTIGSYFPFKNNIKSKNSEALVVYKLTCKTCNASYIGKTERILSLRVDEHRKSADSACNQHEANNEGHFIDYEGIEIVDRATTDFKLKVKELLHILKQKPILNKQLNSQSSFNIKTLIIRAYDTIEL